MAVSAAARYAHATEREQAVYDKRATWFVVVGRQRSSSTIQKKHRSARRARGPFYPSKNEARAFRAAEKRSSCSSVVSMRRSTAISRYSSAIGG